MKLIACLTLLSLAACAQSMPPGDGTRAMNGDMLIGARAQPTSAAVVN